MNQPSIIGILPPFGGEQPVTAAPSASAPAAVPDDLTRAVGKIEAATRFLESRHIENLIAATVRGAVLQAHSPLCDRAGAAALVGCEVSTIDRAVKAGILQAHYLGDSPRFVKAQVIEAITSGRWKFPKKG